MKRLKKIGVRRQLNPMNGTTCIRYKAYDPSFGLARQVELLHRSHTQEWVGVCDVKFPKYGRGLVSLQKIKKDGRDRRLSRHRRHGHHNGRVREEGGCPK